MGKNSNKILLEINAIGAKGQVGTEEIRVKLKQFELCLMPAILLGLTAWGRILTREIEEVKSLKQLLQLPISTSTAGVLMKTGIWPAKEYLQYSTMMLYHSILNSEEERMAKNIVKEQHKETGADIEATKKLRK